jgi:hypothetical protein|tara:strand:- start:123 stop:251 length:129 start_codon:yes stop_codon:yes gene_type:complete
LSLFLPFDFNLVVLLFDEIVAGLKPSREEGNVFEILLVENLD